MKYLENSDSEDEVDNVLTRQNPPVPVNIPTILSQPAEASMPVYPTVVSSPLSHCDPDPSNLSEVPILIGSPEVPDNVQEFSRPHETSGAIAEPPQISPGAIVESPPSISPLSRPRRNVRPPKYLEDYVLK